MKSWQAEHTEISQEFGRIKMMGELSPHRVSALTHCPWFTLLADVFFRFHLITHQLSRKYKITLILKKQRFLSHVFQDTLRLVLQNLVHY